VLPGDRDPQRRFQAAARYPATEKLAAIHAPVSTDALTISHGDVCATYDFEPFRSTNECKKGGWQTMRRADGSEFKNQGDCVSYVNTGK
jgi:hypothetical protein